MNEEKLNQIVEDIYSAYGTGTGVLFGIPSSCSEAVKTVIRLVIENTVKGAIDNAYKIQENWGENDLWKFIEDLKKELGVD